LRVIKKRRRLIVEDVGLGVEGVGFRVEEFKPCFKP